jgi:hypothetical protein
MVPYQKIGELKIYVNNRKLNDCDFNLIERAELANNFIKYYESIASNFQEKEKVSIECEYSKEINLIFDLTITVKFISLYENTKDYPNILSFLYNISDSIKSGTISLKNKEEFKLAIMSSNIASPNVALKLFEKAEFTLLKENGDNILFESDDKLLSFFNDKLRDNFYFVNCFRNTNIHEVDVKLIEARYCLSLGLSLSSISMLCITLEEMLKSLLKYKLLKKLFDASSEKPNLSELSRVSLKVQKEYGSKTLGPCIYLAKKEKIITDEEEDKFKQLQILRDGFVHSDKSKIFSKDKFSVKLINDKFEVVETKDMNILELIFMQGVSQKTILDRDAKMLFYDIENLIHTVIKRFWEVHYS